jgi:methylmalonyl-CoA mutase N-terminal domain/subunit
LRTQQILQLETHVTHTIDPLGGSYFVESLTNQLEKKIEDMIGEIDNMGGLVKAVKQGWIHQEIANTAYEYQKAVESGSMPVVGVNCYQIEDEVLPCDIFKIPETLSIQEKKLERIKKERSAREVAKVLDNLERACTDGENLMDVLVDGVKSYVTEGEISSALKKNYGIWNPPLF